MFAKALDSIEEHGAHERDLAPNYTRPLSAAVELLGQDGSRGEELHRGREVIQ